MKHITICKHADVDILQAWQGKDKEQRQKWLCNQCGLHVFVVLRSDGWRIYSTSEAE